MTKYREYAIHPVDIRATVALQGFYTEILRECAIAKHVARNDELYHDWVKCWKHNYNLLTEVVRETRARTDLPQSQIHEVENYLRRLANTMLNARQYAKDLRRNHS